MLWYGKSARLFGRGSGHGRGFCGSFEGLTLVAHLQKTHRTLSIYIISILAACNNGEASTEKPVEAAAVNLADSVVLNPVAKATILRARAFDRADNTDSARVLYEQAAKQAPEIADWLLLRAAGSTKSESDREDYYEMLQIPAAKDRIPWTEAMAKERSGDVRDAIDDFTALGASLSALRLKIAVAGNNATERANAKKELLAVIIGKANNDIKYDAIAMFDRNFAPVSASENLIIARVAASVGPASRAVTGYKSAFAAGLGNARDKFNLADIYARQNKDQDAAKIYSSIKSPSALAAGAQYQLARAQIALGRTSSARSILRSITEDYPRDTSSASALMLLSDLATDENRDVDARSTLLDVVRRFPDSRHAPAALYRAAMIAYINGDKRTAAREMDSVSKKYPGSSDGIGALYWAGRSWSAAGNPTLAKQRFTSVINKSRESYYAVMSAKRLKLPLISDTSKSTYYPNLPEVNAGLVRAALLRDAGMEVEYKFEINGLFRDALDNNTRMIATAYKLSGTANASRAIALGARAVQEVGRTRRNYRLMFPVVARETLASESKRNGLEPILVASLIRQESSFNPMATSPVGARGLMQLMPDVGAYLAKRQGIPNYSADKLYNPELNIQLGTVHMSGLFQGFRSVEHVLAAYNAGASRVDRWLRKAGADDPEVFIERIPFAETRGYVKNILRNRAFYRELYSW